MPLFYSLCHRTCRALAPLLCRELRVRGLEHVPRSGHAIFVSNHISYWDPLTLLTLVPRQVFFMSKAEMFRYPFVGWFFRALQVFGVERNTADFKALRHALAILERGDLIALYPQGSRAPLPSGQVHTAKPGVLLLAKKSGAPIVPVAISGIETLLMPRFPWLGRPVVSVTFGAPFLVVELTTQTCPADDREQLLAALMKKVFDLLPPRPPC